MSIKKLFSFILCLALLASALPAALVGAATESDAGFSVSAVIPDNQIDTRQTYFDLLMRPGDIQELRVQVYNSSSETIKVDISAVSASTNPNGLIDYQTPGVRDETLQYPFSELAAPLEETLEIEPGEIETAVVRVFMPYDEYDGVVLGGIVLRRQPGELAEPRAEGTVINNIFSYVVGVSLKETDAVVEPDFEFVGAEAGLSNYRPAVIHSIRNTAAAIATDVSISIEVYQKGKTTPAASVELEGYRMAPNSVLPYALLWPGELRAGDYESRVRLSYNGESWSFTDSFTITSAQAGDVNDNAVTDAESQFAPGWVIFLIVLGCLIALLLLILIIVAMRKKKRDTDEPRQNLGIGESEGPTDDEA